MDAHIRCWNPPGATADDHGERGNPASDTGLRYRHAESEYEALLEQVTDQLVEHGILVRGQYDRIWIMGTHRYRTEDGQPLRDVRQRIAGALMNDEIPTLRDVMIMSLADACDLWPSLIHEPETLARYAPRVKQIARMDLIGQVVTQAIHER